MTESFKQDGRSKCGKHWDLLGSDMTVQGAACCVFHDNSQVLVCEKALVEAHNVRVYEPGMVHELPLDILSHPVLQWYSWSVRHKLKPQGRTGAPSRILLCS